MNEVWKDIESYKGAYQVSNFGKVRSLNRTTRNNHNLIGKTLSLRNNNYGYYTVILYKNCVGISFTVHRLVMSAFTKNTDNKPCINHLDEDKHNNHINNLEWVTVRENINYGTRTQRSTDTRARNPKVMIQLIATNIITLDKLFFKSAKEAESFGFERTNVSKCSRGIRPSYKGFTWIKLEYSESV